MRAVRETRGAKIFGGEFDGYKMRPPKLRENHIWEERGGRHSHSRSHAHPFFDAAAHGQTRRKGGTPTRDHRGDVF